MNGVIVIYETLNDPENDVALKALKKLRDITVREVICPCFVKDLYRLPFIQDENDGRYFGAIDIERFVQGRLQNHCQRKNNERYI